MEEVPIQYREMDTVELLVRLGLVDVKGLDRYLASMVGDGMNLEMVEYALTFIQMFSREGDDCKQRDFPATIYGLCLGAQIYREHLTLIPFLRSLGLTWMDKEVIVNDYLAPPQLQLSSAVKTGWEEFKKFTTDPGVRAMEESTSLFDAWHSLFISTPEPNDLKVAYVDFVGRMYGSGLLSSEENISTFFIVALNSCVERAYKVLGDPTYPRHESYFAPDALARFVSLLIRDVDQVERKTHIMDKFLGIMTVILKDDMKKKGGEFQQIPYHRCLLSLYLDMYKLDYENHSHEALMSFCLALHELRPAEASGFAFSWLGIVGHRKFIYRMLVEDHGRWWVYSACLVDLFLFLAPFVKNGVVPKGTMRLIHGTERLLLLLLHDFPDFLAEFSSGYMDILPTTVVQLRNIIQSAMPRLFRAPYTHPYKPEESQFGKLEWVPLHPMFRHDPGWIISVRGFKEDLDEYLTTANSINCLHELKYNFKFFDPDELGNHYHIPLLNAVVLYVGSLGVGAISDSAEEHLTVNAITRTTHFDIFFHLAHDLDREGLYSFFHSIITHLRYPSSHTYYFGVVLLELFRVTYKPIVKEIIARVLLERLFANRPWPWGILVIFRELTENPRYDFWKEPFVNAAPEVKALIAHVKKETIIVKKEGIIVKQEEPKPEQEEDESWTDEDTLKYDEQGSKWPNDETVALDEQGSNWPGDDTLTEAGQSMSGLGLDDGAGPSDPSSEDDTTIATLLKELYGSDSSEEDNVDHFPEPTGIRWKEWVEEDVEEEDIMLQRQWMSLTEVGNDELVEDDTGSHDGDNYTCSYPFCWKCLQFKTE